MSAVDQPRSGHAAIGALMPKLISTFLLLAVAVPVAAQPTLPSSLDLSAIRSLPVQHDGRWPPLDTAAHDYVESVTGQVFFQGHDPVALLLAWTFDSQTWQEQPLIYIGNAELRAELQLPDTRTVFSYAELLEHERLAELSEQFAHRKTMGKPDPLESKVGDINHKLVLLERVLRGMAVRPIPHPDDVLGAWRPVVPGMGHVSAGSDAVTGAWTELQQAFLADDGPGFTAATERLRITLAALPAAYRPEARLIATELRYNRTRPFHYAWMVMAVGAVRAAAAMVVRRKWFDILAILGMLLGFGLVTYGLLLRWQIAGRIPAANMFESLLFLSWGMGAFAIVSMFLFQQRLVPLTASAMGALSLFLADSLPLDHFVRPIVPVLLDTIWMSIHVPVIMVSYSVLALAALIAHLQLVIMASVPRRRQLIDTLDSLHYWYVHVGAILLLAGIITGSMWAASSWGRYWGWDPKEVWSLIAFVGYLTILHVRVNYERVPAWAYWVAALLAIALFVILVRMLAPMSSAKVVGLAGAAVAMVIFVTLRGRFAVALKSVLAFWLLIMTYVGVNYVLGIGLHSYGFGTGAVVRYLFLVGGIDLALIAVCCLAYLFRRQAATSAVTS